MRKANIGLIAATVKTNDNFLVLVRDYRIYGFLKLLALMIVVNYNYKKDFYLVCK
jgi:hypothetical protein